MCMIIRAARRPTEERSSFLMAVSPPEGSKRIAWVDIAKALGVVLVVTGHFLYHTSYVGFNHIIYSFHLPFFFMLSGYVYRVPEKRFGVYIGEKSRRLLIPMSIFVAVMLPFTVMMGEYPSVEKFLERLFFLNGELVCNDPCWYFLVLFEIYVILFFAFKLSRKLWYKLLLCVLCLSSMIIMYQCGGRLVFGLDRAILGAGFLLFGMLLRELEILERPRLPLKLIMAASCFAIWLIFGIVLNKKGSFYMFKLHNSFFFVLAALAACIWVSLLCQLLSRLPEKFVSACGWMGKNSVVIIGTHYMFLKGIEQLFNALHWNNRTVYDFTVPPIIAAILLAYIPICALVNRYIPLLSVEKPKPRTRRRGQAKKI